MAIYRFRVTFEDNEEVYRDIDIKSTQTFYDFHKAILLSINFEDNADSSFFISDDLWRRGDEITLNENIDNTNNKKAKNASPKYVMKICKMASLIDDPHQKFIYIHDPEKQWTFTIELIKILADDTKSNYPKCSKTVGIAPKKIKTPIITPVTTDDDEDGDLDEEDDKEAYAHASEEYGIDEEEGEHDAIEEHNEEEENSDDGLNEDDDEFKPSYGDGDESYFNED